MWPIVAILGLPLIEIALFILAGRAIGLLPTLALVVIAAIAGVAVLRGRGLGAMLEIRASLDRGGDPAAALVDGALAVLAGILLILPGFLSDAVGLALLLPPVRAAVVSRLQAGVRGSAGRGPREPAATVIDGTWHEVRDDVPPMAPPGGSGWTRH